jgi:hypothetical protein
MSYRVAILGTAATLLSMALPAQASESCIPIPLVGGQGNSVTKTVSQPTIPGPLGINITRNNWNTDWAVPGGQKFRRFIVTITPQDTAQFTIQVFLRYSDQTADQFFNSEGETFPAGVPIVVKAESRPSETPFQVNLLVNGLAAFGRTYSASVVGCR